MALRTNTVHRHFPSSTTAHSLGLTAFFNETAGGTFTDETTDANSTSFNDVTMLGATGDKMYVGSNRLMNSLRLQFWTSPVGGTRTWEYWNGTAWTSLTVTAVVGNTNLNSNNGPIVKWTPPSDWATTTVNGTSAYWIRTVVGTAYSPAGVGTTITPGYVHSLGSMTFDIAETASRTIRSAIIRLHWKATNEAGYPVHVRIGCKLGSNAISYVLDDSNEYMPSHSTASGPTWEIQADATSYFAANFGGGATETLTLDASWILILRNQSAFTSVDLTNISASVIVTYEYDDAGITSAVKTVFIPIESSTSALTTSLVEIGTNQVPLLDTFCPEASKSFKEICFVLRGQYGANPSGTGSLALALDNDTESVMGTIGSTSNYTTNDLYHWLPTVTTSAVHAFKARTTSSTLNQPGLGGYIAVTYTYNPSTSTTILNSLMLPINGQESSLHPLNTAADAAGSHVDFWIEEPATITLQQSGVMMFMALNYGSGITWNTKVGGQASYRALTFTSTFGTRAYLSFVQRFDSGAAGGSGLTIARGKNRIIWDYYVNNLQNAFSSQSAVAIVNYISGKAADGVGVHNHTTIWNLQSGPLAPANHFLTTAAAPVVPESNYFVNNVGIQLLAMVATQEITLNLRVDRLSGESVGRGWIDLFTRNTSKNTLSSTGQAMHWSDATEFFTRGGWDTNPERLVLETARRYMVNGHYSNTAGTHMLPYLAMYLTYHAVAFAWAGTVEDGSGTPQSGATVTLHRNDTGEIVGTDTTDGSGDYSITWFDDTVEVHSQVRISGTLMGRSDDGYAA